jgi:hypothetical protein
MAKSLMAKISAEQENHIPHFLIPFPTVRFSNSAFRIPHSAFRTNTFGMWLNSKNLHHYILFLRNA